MKFELKKHLKRHRLGSSSFQMPIKGFGHARGHGLCSCNEHVETKKNNRATEM